MSRAAPQLSERCAMSYQGISHSSVGPFTSFSNALGTLTASAYPKSCATALERFHCRSGRVSLWLMPLLGVSKRIGLNPWWRERQCVQLQPMQELGRHSDSSDSVSSACSCQGLAEPCPLCGLLSVPVAALSKHAHPVMPILHITFVFCPRPARSGTVCRMPSASLHPARRFPWSHVSASLPPPGFAVHMLLLSLPRPCRAVTVLLSLLPPCLACRHA